MVKPFELMPSVMRKRAAEVVTGTTRIVRRAATAIDRRAVRDTPVDKGVARSNWVGTLNVPFSGVIPAYSPGSKLGLQERANAQAAIAQAQVAIRGYEVGRSRSIHLTNNVPWLGRLNSGSSQQAPALFVQKAIQTGILSIKGAKVLKG